MNEVQIDELILRLAILIERNEALIAVNEKTLDHARHFENARFKPMENKYNGK